MLLLLLLPLLLPLLPLHKKKCSPRSASLPPSAARDPPHQPAVRVRVRRRLCRASALLRGRHEHDRGGFGPRVTSDVGVARK